MCLTHGGGEDDDAKDVHLLAGAGTCLVCDLRRWSQLQVHCLTFGVAIIRDDVDKVGLDSSRRYFKDGNQVCFVLNKETAVSIGEAQYQRRLAAVTHLLERGLDQIGRNHVPAESQSQLHRIMTPDTN